MNYNRFGAFLWHNNCRKCRNHHPLKSRIPLFHWSLSQSYDAWCKRRSRDHFQYSRKPLGHCWKIQDRRKPQWLICIFRNRISLVFSLNVLTKSIPKTTISTISVVLLVTSYLFKTLFVLISIAEKLNPDSMHFQYLVACFIP